MNRPEHYYKVKAKAFESNSQIWIVVKADSIHQAFHKAEDHCRATKHIFYPVEQTLYEITEKEYVEEMSKRNRPKNSQ